MPSMYLDLLSKISFDCYMLIAGVMSFGGVEFKPEPMTRLNVRLPDLTQPWQGKLLHRVDANAMIKASASQGSRLELNGSKVSHVSKLGAVEVLLDLFIDRVSSGLLKSVMILN